MMLVRNTYCPTVCGLGSCPLLTASSVIGRLVLTTLFQATPNGECAISGWELYVSFNSKSSPISSPESSSRRLMSPVILDLVLGTCGWTGGIVPDPDATGSVAIATGGVDVDA